MQALSILVLMQCVSRAQVHCHVNARLIMDCLPQGCMYTGTPMFMAISTLQGWVQGESSELESALYVFLYWATRDRLHWKRARFNQISLLRSLLPLNGLR